MLAVFAEFERATIIDRAVAGMERKAARGGWTSGSHPFGYTLDPATGFLTTKADEAPLVPVIFELYAKKRLGARAVSLWLNRRGHRTRKGVPSSTNAVLTVLAQPDLPRGGLLPGRIPSCPASSIAGPRALQHSADRAARTWRGLVAARVESVGVSACRTRCVSPVSAPLRRWCGERSQRTLPLLHLLDATPLWAGALQRGSAAGTRPRSGRARFTPPHVRAT